MPKTVQTHIAALSLIILLGAGVCRAADPTLCRQPGKGGRSTLPRCEDRTEATLVENQRRIKELEALQHELASKSTHAGAPEKNSGSAEEIARQEALVNKLLKEYASQPRKGFVSPRSENPALRAYQDTWIAQVEQYGKRHFPRAKGQSLYGSVQLQVAVAHDGKLLEARVIRASPDARLNAAALEIIRAAAPFPPLSPEIRKEYDILEFVRTLTFTREESPSP